MTQRPLSRIVLAAFALTLFSGRIEAQIVQCVDEAGASTFSDGPCEAGSLEKQDTNTSPDTSQLVARKMSQDEKFAAAEDARTVVWASRHFPKRRLASDIATVKSAKVSVVSMDLARKLKADLQKA